jgi:enoyl-CoA hydratase
MTTPMTNPSPLTVTFEDRLALVQLNRPEVRNALSRSLMRELTALARQLAERDDVDVVLLTGAGPCFSAGADLKDAQAWADDALSLTTRRANAAVGYRMCQAWEAMPQITIVAVEGYAVGGALALSLACDWRVLADDAFVSLPEIALGIPLTWGAIPRLVSLVGPARAKRLTILCERVAAAEALGMGLVDHVAPAGQALAVARHLGGHMAHDQIALVAASADSRAARASALKRPDGCGPPALR